LVYELQGNAERNVFTIYNGSNWGLAGRAVEARMVVPRAAPHGRP